MWQKVRRDPDKYGELIPVKAVAPLIDGATYFKAFMLFAKQAKRRLFIMGWDFDTRLVLEQNSANEHPLTLGMFLEHLLTANSDLEIRILCWDFAEVYLFERQLFPTLRFSNAARSRLFIKYDGQHVAGSSQHQKVVLIDNDVVFLGGVDFGIGRNDTREHKQKNATRNSGFRRQFPPLHDVQIVLSGFEIGRYFEQLAMSRWSLAANESLTPLREHHEIKWPESISSKLHGASVLISFTRPSFAGMRGSYQIQSVIAEAISCTKRLVYIENQFFTSKTIYQSLKSLLRSNKDATILMVLPSSYHSWLEEYVIGFEQKALIQSLQNEGGRDRVFATGPVLFQPNFCPIGVHSKVLILDDSFLSIGSANFNNRSMGLDFEVNVSFFGEQGDDVRKFIVDLRNDLLMEHMDLHQECDIDELCRRPQKINLLLASRERRRGLKSLSMRTRNWPRIGRFLMPIIDARRALPPALFIQKLFRYYASPLFLKPLSSIFLFYFSVGSLVGVYLIRPYFPLPFAVSMFASIMAMSFLPFTLNVGLMIASEANVASWERFLIACSLCFIGAHLLGYIANAFGLKNWYRMRYYSLFSQQGFSEQSFLSLTFIRLLPLVPFGFFNFFASVFGVNVWRSWVSAVMSMIPSIVGMAMTVGFVQLFPTENESFGHVAESVLLILALVLALILMRRFIRRRKIS